MRSDAARNRQALIDAALALFNEHALAPTLDDVAREAGVGVGTAYRHFANKTDLALAALDSSLESMLQAAERAAAVPDGWSGLAEFFEVTLRPQATQQALRAILATDPESPRMAQVHRRIGDCLETLLEKARRQGTVREDVVVSDLAVVATLMGESMRLFGTVAPHSWKRFLPLLLDGLRPGATTAMHAAPLTERQFVAGIASQTRRPAAPPTGGRSDRRDARGNGAGRSPVE